MSSLQREDSKNLANIVYQNDQLNWFLNSEKDTEWCKSIKPNTRKEQRRHPSLLQRAGFDLTVEELRDKKLGILLKHLT